MFWKDRVTNYSTRDRVERHHTMVDLIKQRQLKLFGHICRMKDQQLVKAVLGMVKTTGPAEDHPEDGSTASETGAAAHYQKRYVW